MLMTIAAQHTLPSRLIHLSLIGSICFTARLESCERFLIQSIDGCERQGEFLGCGKSIALLRSLQFRAFLRGENGHV